MAGKRAGTFLALMERMERFTLNRVWTDLADDEFFFEPVEGMWGIRRRDECVTSTPFGGGDWVADFGPGIEPMTTIGWLLWHIGSLPGRLIEVDFFGGTRTIASGWTSPYLTHHSLFTSAAGATDTLRTGWNALQAALETAEDERLEQRTASYTYSAEPFRGGLAVLGAPGPELSGYVFVAATLNEISHHGAQICVLRDLWRQSAVGVRAR